MTGLGDFVVDTTVQCWGCPVFDQLFGVVSNAAAAVYGRFSAFCALLLSILLAFYIAYAVWSNIKGGINDPWYKKTATPAIMGAIIALFLLGLGLWVPRFITAVAFEPTADIALIYTQSMIESSPDIVNTNVTYTPIEMSDNGFFRPQLRDTIIMMMKTTITQFQAYIKLGLAIMDAAFSWTALLGGIGGLVKHIIWFFIGLYLAYAFFKLFFRFCLYFVDIIIAMAFFAFFFPLSVAMTAFNGASDVPSWISGIGRNLGVGRIKNLINAIIALVASIITYTVIMTIIAKFFSAPGASSADLMSKIISGDVMAADLSEDNLAAMTLMGAIVLVYLMNFLYAQIPQVTKMILSAFNVGTENKLSEEMADNAMHLTKIATDKIKSVGATILSGGKKEGGAK